MKIHMNVNSVKNLSKEESRNNNTYTKIDFDSKLDVVLCEYDIGTNKLLRKITYKRHSNQVEEVYRDNTIYE